MKKIKLKKSVIEVMNMYPGHMVEIAKRAEIMEQNQSEDTSKILKITIDNDNERYIFTMADGSKFISNF